jgi:hypothetical protein
MSLENMFVAQRNNQKDVVFSGMFNKVIQVYIQQEFEFRASRHSKLISIIAARQPGCHGVSPDTTLPEIRKLAFAHA